MKNPSPQTIRNIIFDLGGIILNIDYFKTEAAFIALGVTNFSELFTQYHANDFFINFEKGCITPKEFLHQFKQNHAGVTDDQITIAWNAMLLDFPPSRIKRLLELKSRYRTFVLSNTNAIHHQAFLEIELGTGDVATTIDACFEKVYYSHEIGLRKPDAAIYEYVLNENNLKAAETLFIDDTRTNVTAAEKLGIQACFLEKPATLEELLKDF